MKAAGKPKFKVRGYTRCQRCGRPQAVYRKFGLCRICFREMAHAGRAARRHQVLLVTGLPHRTHPRCACSHPPQACRVGFGGTGARKKKSHDDDRPDRRHADASAQRQLGVPRHGGDAALEDQGRTSPRSSSRRVTSPASTSPTPPRVGRPRADVDLKYGPNRERSIAGVRRVSKPGLRVYAKSTGLPRVLGGLGVAIISTSTGLLTDRQAAKRGVGGEVLAYVW